MTRYRPKEGHIELWRRLLKHRYWPTQEKRAFTKLEAWIDLLYLASFKAHVRYFQGRRIELKRGELVTSERTLASKWQWSRTKLRAFLEALSTNAEIDHWKDRGLTFIRIHRMADCIGFVLGDKTTAQTEEKTTIEVPPSSTPPVIVIRAVASDTKPQKIGGFVDKIVDKWKKRRKR